LLAVGLVVGVCRWRELNAAADWLAAERQLRPLAQSLPLLLHHKQQVRAPADAAVNASQ
jgi:hypothetical protein